MQYIGDEIKINIFKYVNYPLNLALTCRNWSVFIKNPYAKSEWLIVNYGKAHSLFYAINLGPTFIDIAVCQTLIARDIIVFTRYFTQRLIQLKIEYNDNINQIGADRLSYVSNLPVSVFIYLFNEGYKQLSTKNLTSKCNDIHAIPQSLHVINNSLGRNNLKYIENLILNKRSTLFLRRPKVSLPDLNSNPKQLKDGYPLRQESFSRQYIQTRPVTVFTLFTNNFGSPIAQLSRSINQRRHNQLRRRRIINRSYQRYRRNASINNEDTLNRIANLPRQITNDPLIQQFFNGSSFI
ncbi:unnamed protein product [Rhizophagus irregularis]|nr:unnamed protein product [Rhizophagus irregularis]